jgi:hypothetical protein
MSRRRAAAAAFVAALLLAPLASGESPPSRQPGAQHLNVQTRPSPLGDDGENDYASLLLFALAAGVVFIVIPTQIAKGVTRRRAATNRTARSLRGNHPNDA